MTRIKFLLPLLALFVSVCAMANIASGTCGKSGDNIKWVISDDGTLTLSGSGQMKDFDGGVDSPWYDWSDDIKKVVIGDGITSIGECSFNTCELITSITIPNSVTSIGTWAIGNCKQLTSVRIPKSVTSIGNYAFAFCSKLADVTCKATKVPTIGSDAFMLTLASSGTLHVPEASIEDYKKAEQWKLWKNIVAAAPDVIASGNCGKSGDNVKWTLTDDGVLALTGSGEMKDFESSSTPWGTSRDYITKLSISEGVTSIGDYAFFKCDNITSVTIPNTVTSIGKSAFSDCYNLVSVTIPNSVTTIGFQAFKNCKSLASVTIPNSVTNISTQVFFGCGSLTSVTIPNSLTTIPQFTFSGCSSLTSVTIPNSVTRIAMSAFAYCSKLTSVTIPNSVTIIESGVFQNCSSLTSITIPNSVTKIDNATFEDCTALTSISIPNSVTSIGEAAFTRCTSLTSFTLPNSVTSIGSTAFSGCKGLTSFTIPNSITKVNGRTFENCENLTSVTIGSSVTYIDYCAFDGCTKLTKVTCEATKVPGVGGTVFFNVPLSSANLYVPIGSVDNYKNAEQWKEFGNIVGDASMLIASGNCGKNGDNIKWTLTGDGSLTLTGSGEMKDFIFSPWHDYTKYVKKLSMSEGITSIGDDAFSMCESLTSVTIPNSVTSIGIAAFLNCSGLTSVTIGNSVTSIGIHAFFGCSSLSSITIPNSVTSIGGAAFVECSGLTSVVIPNSITSIDVMTFQLCTGLTSVTIPNSVTSIGDDAFYRCSSLTSVTIPNSVTSIGNQAFLECSSLTSVTIPNSVTSIGGAAFYDCTNLTKVTCEATKVPNVDVNAFDNVPLSTAILYVPDASLKEYMDTKPWSNFSSIKAIEELSAEADAAKFKADNETILNKTTSTVASTDLDAITKALGDYDKLTKYAQARLTAEKTLLDNLKTKVEELKAAEAADAAATAEAAKFKADNADILGKTTETVASSDLDAINKALGDYDKLSEAAKAKLTDGEKALLDALKTKAEALKAAEEADAAATAEAEKFKADNAAILAKTTETVASTDIEAINKALEDYGNLSEAAKAKLTDGEKDLLDALKTKAIELMSAEEADAVAAADAAKFKTDNADILGKTTETVASTDIEAINKALGDYDGLSEAAKAKLTDGEKDLLDALKTKAEELKAAEEAAAAADAAATADAENFKADNKDILDKSLDSITADDLAAIDKALSDYDKLSEAAKAKLTDGEKSDLDSKKTKAEELASSISAVTKTDADVYYNMNGQRTNRSAKGILIKNGKKVLVR